MPSWIQINGKLIPKEEYRGDNTRNQSSMVIPPLEPFVSPIDGQVIKNRQQLKQHNKDHGVTNTSDYSPQFLENVRKERQQRQEKESREHRIHLIKEQLHRS